MPWMRFTRKFDWRVPPAGRVTVAYKPGVLLVTRACAEAAIAAGAAEKARRPSVGKRRTEDRGRKTEGNGESADRDPSSDV